MKSKKKSEAVAEKCSQPQQRFLLNELQDLYRRNLYPKAPTVKVGSVVWKARRQMAAAKKVLDAYERRNRTAQDKLDARQSALRAAAREAIYFGTPDEALAAVQAFRDWMKNPKP